MLRKMLIAVMGVSLLGTFPAQANTRLPDSFSGGVITGVQVLADKGSPYTITVPIDIPEASELRIEPGVVIRASSAELFRVQGSLLIRGSAAKKVRVYPRGSFFTPIAGSSGEAKELEISHAHINGGTPLQMFFPGVLEFTLADSDFVNQNCQFGNLNWIKIQNRNSAMQRNFFQDTCGFDIHVTYGVFGPRGTFNITNNHFRGNPKTDGWIKASSLWKDSVTLTGNSFIGVTKKAILQSSTPVQIDDNFWGELSVADARKLVDGSIATTFTPANISLTKILSAPAQATPTNPYFSEPVVVAPTPSPTPTPTPSPSASVTPEPTPSPATSAQPTKPAPVKIVKYATCKAMQAVHPGGVAKSAAVKNKGAKTRLKPLVNTKLYGLNVRLDVDRDGIACER